MDVLTLLKMLSQVHIYDRAQIDLAVELIGPLLNSEERFAVLHRGHWVADANVDVEVSTCVKTP